MTNQTTDDHHHAGVVTAALMACFVQTLKESDPSFQDRFLKRLSEAQYMFRESGADVGPALELLGWTREFLTGFSYGAGRGEPLVG